MMLLTMWLVVTGGVVAGMGNEGFEAVVSSMQAGYGAAGAVDKARFGCGEGEIWKGEAAKGPWWWEAAFAEPEEVGAIVQVVGDDPCIFRNAPKRYVWQWSEDGETWRDLEETRTEGERRMYRVHRLKEPVRASFLRLMIWEAEGEYPSLRDVQWVAEPDGEIPFEDWVVVVSTTEKSDLPGEGMRFLDLARMCEGWEGLEGQHVWLDTFDEAFVSAEPRPLCAFLSGSFKDWCERTREPFRGMQEVLKAGNLPIWGACGGAQALAILDTAGVDAEWDCPHCRDAENPKLPVYTHIGHTAKKPCGDYSACVDERGVFNMLQIAEDPVFEGLPRQFGIMESHCGQIEFVPEGWTLVVTRGEGAKTKTQCMRRDDRPIYAAQFHIELFDETVEVSKEIMRGFLEVAKDWGGYNPERERMEVPRALKREREGR